MKKETILPVRLDARQVAALEALRRAEPDMPTRAEMVRRVVMAAAEHLAERAERK